MDRLTKKMTKICEFSEKYWAWLLYYSPDGSLCYDPNWWPLKTWFWFSQSG